MLKDYVVIDMEMTGLSSFRDKIIEIGAVKVRNGAVLEEFQTLVNPNVNIPEKIVEITGITNEMVEKMPYAEEVLRDFFHFLGNDVIVGHNLRFDFSFLMQAAYDNGQQNQVRTRYGIDTLKIAKKYLERGVPKRLAYLCERYNIVNENHHRALNDAIVTKQLYEILCDAFEKNGVKIEPEEYAYKPKREQLPSKKEFERVERLIKSLGVTPKQDIYRMTQGELSRYADWLRFNQYNF